MNSNNRKGLYQLKHVLDDLIEKSKFKSVDIATEIHGEIYEISHVDKNLDIDIADLLISIFYNTKSTDEYKQLDFAKILSITITNILDSSVVK
jgi:hypothetical protein